MSSASALAAAMVRYEREGKFMVADGFGEAKPLGAGAPAPSPQPSPPPASRAFDVFADPVGPPPEGLRLPDAPPVYHQGPPPPPAAAGPPMAPLGVPLFGSTERNWMGVVSLVLGLLGGGLLGLGFGIAGLSAVRAGRATNRTMAVWGIVLNCTMWFVYIGLFAGAGALATALEGSSILEADPFGDDSTTGYAEVTGIPLGSCFAEPSSDETYFYDAQLVACDEPHYGQVYSVGTLEDQLYPGEQAMSEIALDLCFTDDAVSAIDPAIASELYGSVYFPGSRAWNLGDRDYSCYVWDERGPLTRSVFVTDVQGAGRT